MKLHQIIEDAPAGATSTGSFAKAYGKGTGAIRKRPTVPRGGLVWDSKKKKWRNAAVNESVVMESSATDFINNET